MKVTIFLVLVLGLFVTIPCGAATSIFVPLVYDGFYVGWTPSVSGVLHFSMVDELACNTSDWNSTEAQGKADSYGADLRSIPNGSNVYNIHIISCVAANQAGTGSSELRVYFRLNGMLNTFYGFPYGSFNLTNTTLHDEHVAWGYSFIKDANTTLEAVLVYGRGTQGVKASAVKIHLLYNAP